jgi:hypothetical protein
VDSGRHPRFYKAGPREGRILDYKSGVSEMGNWPRTLAAFSILGA